MSGNSIFIISLILSPPVKTSQLTKCLSANCVISYLTGPLEWQRASLVAQTVKNLPAMRETWVRSLGWEDPWRRAWQPTPILAWRIPMDRGAHYSPWCHKESDTTEQPSTLEWQEGICKLFVGRISAYVIIRELDKAEDIKSKNLKRQWGQGDVCACSVAHSCPTLWDPMDCSLLGSSVHGVFQARILDWVAISFSRGYSQFRDRTRDSCIGRWLLYLPLSHLGSQCKVTSSIYLWALSS